MIFFFFFKQKTAYEMRISDWSSDVCSSDLKTTLFQLVQRFYDPQQGVEKVDGTPLPKVDPAALRARIAVVPQESVIFAASARDNLRYGQIGRASCRERVCQYV